MREPRRMRRFAAACGTEFDELPGGYLRRRLKYGDKSPLPKPQTRVEIEQRHGELREMTTVELTIEKGRAKR